MSELRTTIVGSIASVIVASALAALSDLAYISPILILQSIGAGVTTAMITWFAASWLNQHQSRKQYSVCKDQSDGESLANLQEDIWQARKRLHVYASYCRHTEQSPSIAGIEQAISGDGTDVCKNLRRLVVPYPLVSGYIEESWDPFMYYDNWDRFLDKLHLLAAKGDIKAARQIWPLYKGLSRWRRWVRVLSLRSQR